MNAPNSLDPFKGFVSLTNLLISDCRIPIAFKIFQISAPQLSNLTMSNMEHIGSISPECKIVISSTKITSFIFIDSHALEFSVASIHSIQTVYVDVPEVFYLIDYLNLINMFRAFGDAKTVMLSFRTLSVLSLFPDALHHPSPFTGMKILKVKVPHEPCSITVPVDVITFLLNGSPAKDFKVEFVKQVSSQSMGEN